MRADRTASSPSPFHARRAVWLVLALLIGVSAPDPTYAYIDPNIGGQLYQALYPVLALVAGLFVFMREQLRMIAARVVAAVRRMFRKAP